MITCGSWTVAGTRSAGDHARNVLISTDSRTRLRRIGPGRQHGRMELPAWLDDEVPLLDPTALPRVATMVPPAARGLPDAAAADRIRSCLCRGPSRRPGSDRVGSRGAARADSVPSVRRSASSCWCVTEAASAASAASRSGTPLACRRRHCAPAAARSGRARGGRPRPLAAIPGRRAGRRGRGGTGRRRCVVTRSS
jgi:hypothetical protein